MRSENQSFYKFEDFELHPARRSLARSGEKIALTPKTFEVLSFLVANAGRVVLKQEILAAVWSESFVEESNLTQHIFWLRKALTDKASFIATLPGRGYQFIPSVELIEPATEPEHPTDSAFPASNALLPGSTGPRKPIEISRRTIAYVAIVFVMVSLAILFWLRFRPTPASTFHQLVLADFVNTTGDPTFDHILTRALQIDLEQSPFLDTLSDRDTVATLQMMGRQPDIAITADIAHELCERNNRQVLLTGQLSSVGSQYLLTLEATDCRTGRRLAAAKSTAAAREQVLTALDAAAAKLRSGLGESSSSVHDFDVPLVQATTSSLEALRAYSLGISLAARADDGADVASLFQKAIDLDPQFALAYNALGTHFYNNSEYALATQNFTRALDLSSHVSARERLIIQAHYYAEGKTDLDQGIKIYRLWASTYPHDFEPHLNLANQFTQLGQYGASIDEAVQALHLQPDRPTAYSVLARAYMRGSRLAEAQATGAQAVQHGKDSASLHSSLLLIAFYQQDQPSHDSSALATETTWAEKNISGWYGWFFPASEAIHAVALGNYQAAQTLFTTAYETAREQQQLQSADSVLQIQAEDEYALGLPAAARLTLHRLRKQDIDDPALAILCASLGDPAPAQLYLSKHPADASATFDTFLSVPQVKAALAMQQGRPLDAISDLEISRPYELSSYDTMARRAEAYLQSNQPQKAVLEYRKLLTNPGIQPSESPFPFFHIGLARSLAAAHDLPAARAEYETFFQVWKSADPTLPLLRQAHLEYARLVPTR